MNPSGVWDGVNGFRLMPGDVLQEFPATAAISTAAGGALTVFTYTWQHPEDGPQDGLLLISAAGEEQEVTGVWGDSWHQKPETMTLSGTRVTQETTTGVTEEEITLSTTYSGDWGWVILLAVGADGELRMRMDNVVPDEHGTADAPAGAYPVMVLRAERP